MSYLKRKDGTVQTVNGQPVDYVKQQFVVVDANSVGQNSPSEDLLTQDAFNRFLLLTIAHVRNFEIPFTATAQTYTATEEDYREKFGTASVAYPVTVTSSLGYDRWLQSTADTMARTKARETVLNRLRFSPLPNTKNSVVLYSGRTEEDTDALGPSAYRQYNTYVTSKQPVRDIQFYTVQNGGLVPVGTSAIVEFVLYTAYFRADDNDTTYANGPYDVVAVATLIDGTKVQSVPRRINLNMPAPPPPAPLNTLLSTVSGKLKVYRNKSVNLQWVYPNTGGSVLGLFIESTYNNATSETQFDYMNQQEGTYIYNRLYNPGSRIGTHTLQLKIGFTSSPDWQYSNSIALQVFDYPAVTVSAAAASVGQPVTLGLDMHDASFQSAINYAQYSVFDADGNNVLFNNQGSNIPFSTNVYGYGTTVWSPVAAGVYTVRANVTYLDNAYPNHQAYAATVTVTAPDAGTIGNVDLGGGVIAA